MPININSMTNKLTVTDQKIDFIYTPTVNFALQQNHIPIVRSLILNNTTTQDWQDVTIEIISEPDFALPWKKTIEVVRAGDNYEFGSISLTISSKYLAELTERITGRLTVKLSAEGWEGYEEHFPIDLLAYDQWNGIGLLPEMLAAFITPNHPEIPKLLHKASAILEKWTGNPSFDEYQRRNPDRVKKQMAAIYEAIAELQLVYCAVPASFEQGGQRIRLSDAIFSNRLANCLDLSLLYAACLEAIGLHALVVITKGHAFCGAWLIDETFADAVNDDPSLISKRTADGISEIVIVETTCMNVGSQVPFDQAVLLAGQKLLADDFILFVDVKRSRFAGIRPLPLRIATPTGWEIIEEVQPERRYTSPEAIYVGEKLSYTETINVSKQQLWERKLLDLTLRNSLLNLRITKGVIQFLTLNAGKLEDALANGDEFQVLAKPTDWDNPLRDALIYKGINATDPMADLVRHELSKKRIRSYLSETELELSLKHIFRSSRVAMEENGANTLYVGLGLLKWYETDNSEKPRYAPILLQPVEIIRKSAQKGYIIRSREEDTIMNITLLEMIRQDFGISIGGLEILPKEETGVDVKLIFNIIRQAVMSKSRWDVEDQAVLGTFSFSKFILWNDIHHNASQLYKNKVVSSLVSGKLEWETADEDLSSVVLDDQLHPANIALPISSDSSQLQAVIQSGHQKSFVLHGPPGTGKSQTITNIIANALYAGKKVLFVSAKMAALEVVQTRLESIGIGPFCLELHSNKSKKSAVLQQLKEATEVVLKSPPENFAAEADRLFEVRKELNQYVDALHKKYPFGYSLFDLFSLYGQQNLGAGRVEFPLSSFETIDSAQLINWLDLAEEMQSTGLLIGSPKGHALQAIHIEQYTPAIKQEITALLERMRGLLNQLQQQNVTVSALLKLDNFTRSREQEEAFVTMISQLLQLPDVPSSLLQADAFEQTLTQLIGICNYGITRDTMRNHLLARFQKEVLTLPAAQLLKEWNIASGQWLLLRWAKHNAIHKNLQRLSSSGQLEPDEVVKVLTDIMSYQEEQDVIDQAAYLPATLGFLWNNGNCNWNALQKICKALIKINKLTGKITGLPLVAAWRLALAAEFVEGSQSYFTAHQSGLSAYLSAAKELQQTTIELKQFITIDYSVLPASTSASGENWLPVLSGAVTGWLNHIDDLKDWYSYIRSRERAVNAGLQPLVTIFAEGSIASHEIVNHYLSGLYRSAAAYIIEHNPNLATFSGTLFEDKIRKFRELSKRFETLTKDELYAKLAAKIPSFTREASQSSELGILQKNIRNNGRATSIRKIFDDIPNLLHRLTPCMLMSPISVAQYFDAKSVKFDLVIFDEASQMPTCEAVGAIARADNVIIVGDPKQMPPTNFFSTSTFDEDNVEKEDLESILDDCLALSMPSQHLLWHYRSRHESLIAFSNARYYDNQLLTFPSPDDITSKVSFALVEGHYDRGKTKQNRFEAKAIVDEVVRRLSDPQLAKRSIGIVTFSSVQQTLIEDTLNEVFRKRPDLEKIAMESDEPLFIKNLENVQGDERDIILFSICYGPDSNGKFGLNFGPVNREGGWRRLNVAVSRARYEMKVFSTFKADQLDLNRTRSEGMAGLKAFLNFADKGKSALPGKTKVHALALPGFESLIAEQIRKHGYEVHTQIGCSAYQIDLGVVNKDNPSEYILGILCDGKSYFAAKTSKDREIIQTDMLKSLGWNIHKIWSAEWWERPEKVISGIIEAIRLAEDNLANGYHQQLLEEQEVIHTVPQETLSHSYVVEKSWSAVYEVAQLEKIDDLLLPASLLLNEELMSEQIVSVLEIESPISKSLLSKRILTASGMARTTPKFTVLLDDLISQLDIHQELYDQKIFLWKKDHRPADYSIYRIAGNDTERREADHLSPAEVSNGVHEVLKNQISLLRTDLVKEVAKLFGYGRIGANVELAMQQGIDKAIERGFVRMENDRVFYVG